MPERVCTSYKILVGMEIHVQLATQSKMFTGASNASGALKANQAPPSPNSAVDEQVLGLPGVLPVMNKRAVEFAVMCGLALGCKIAPFTKWDRKSYYYPDLPKNYQISQYDMPLCYEGTFEIADARGAVQIVRIRRAHLEEDAGKLLHEAPGGFAIDHSIVDLNRAGTPLLEIVTEPDLSTPEQVANFAQELQKLVQFLGVSEGQMQLGHMRFEPNINVHITDSHGQVHKTAITEIKNLNSFSVLEKATAYEVKRQIRQWEETGSLGKKSTYGWDDAKQETYWQRDKEEAHDYRYFPDPDLVPVVVDETWLSEIKSQVGELPTARRKRYTHALQLNHADAAALTSDRRTGDLFESAVQLGADPKRACNLIINILGQLANKRSTHPSSLGISATRLADVAKLVDSSKITASNALPLLEKLVTLHSDAPSDSAATATSTEQIAEQLGLIQVSDTGAIDAAIDALIAQNPKSLQDYMGGKATAIGSLVGMVMKSSKGLNPKLVQERLKARLNPSP